MSDPDELRRFFWLANTSLDASERALRLQYDLDDAEIEMAYWRRYAAEGMSLGEYEEHLSDPMIPFVGQARELAARGLVNWDPLETRPVGNIGKRAMYVAPWAIETATAAFGGKHLAGRAERWALGTSEEFGAITRMRLAMTGEAPVRWGKMNPEKLRRLTGRTGREYAYAWNPQTGRTSVLQGVGPDDIKRLSLMTGKEALGGVAEPAHLRNIMHSHLESVIPSGIDEWEALGQELGDIGLLEGQGAANVRAIVGPAAGKGSFYWREGLSLDLERKAKYLPTDF